jgi:hypothetical protein
MTSKVCSSRRSATFKNRQSHSALQIFTVQRKLSCPQENSDKDRCPIFFPFPNCTPPKAGSSPRSQYFIPSSRCIAVLVPTHPTTSRPHQPLLFFCLLRQTVSCSRIKAETRPLSSWTLPGRPGLVEQQKPVEPTISKSRRLHGC